MAIPVRNAGAAPDQRVVHGHTVQLAAVAGGHQVLVDGRVVATDEQDDRVVIQGVYEGRGRAYVLVEEQSGGNACPSMFQAIDLTGSAPFASPQFGNCSDLPRVSVVNGALAVLPEDTVFELLRFVAGRNLVDRSEEQRFCRLFTKGNLKKIEARLGKSLRYQRLDLGVGRKDHLLQRVEKPE